jgi:heat-inducible transcriptional repressor
VRTLADHSRPPLPVSSEPLDLTARQRALLRAVVEEYIATAVPVASDVLARRPEVGVSAATVRNELALLEELGYVVQPHTSAGRVPSERGYRYYVARLMAPVRLHPAEHEALRQALFEACERMARSPEHLVAGTWLRGVAAALARLARAPAVITAPRPVGGHIRHIRLVPVQERLLLLVAVFTGGIVEEQLVPLTRPVTARELDACTERLNRLLRVAAPECFLPEWHTLPELDAQVVRACSRLLHSLERGEPRAVYHYGAAYLLDQPEFRTPGRARPVLEVLERGEVMAHPWSATIKDGVAVVIGSENRHPALRECSLLAATYYGAGHAGGTLAVLGPTRLRYAYTIAVLRSAATLLSELLAAITAS